MKIKTIKFCSLFLYVLLIFQLVSAFPISFSNKNETLIVKDSDAITGLPNRFRDLTNLNIIERKKYLETLRNADILDNHKLTKENSFLMELYLKTQENNIGDEKNILKVES